MRNRTGIEDWILEKANYRFDGATEEFLFPYDLGTWDNIKQVADWGCAPVGDGIHWKVRKGCNQYTLTVICLSSMEAWMKNYKLWTPFSPSYFTAGAASAKRRKTSTNTNLCNKKSSHRLYNSILEPRNCYCIEYTLHGWATNPIECGRYGESDALEKVCFWLPFAHFNMKI